MNIKTSLPGRSLSLPLFAGPGNNREGEIRCGTCHDFHNPLPLLTGTVNTSEKRGAYLRLSADGPSAVCVESHPAQSLVKGTDHDFGATAPDAVAGLGTPPVPGDTCGGCHKAHSENPLPYLWSAPLGPNMLEGWEKSYASENDSMVRLCTGCHAPGKIAQTAVPSFGLHPRDTSAAGIPATAMKHTGDTFPLFMETGEKKDTGHIVCVTCHNPHQWDPRVDAPGSGKNVKGTVATSFLRPNLAVEFCSNCHGQDTLIRFTYFHSPLGRKTGN